jgi:hypothetical protein
MKVIFNKTGNEAMRIDSNGNIGIGTISPSSKIIITEKEALTEWYKKGVERSGLTPHTKEKHGNSKT